MADHDVTDLTPAERAALHTFAVPAPPQDLAERILQAVDRPARVPAPRRRVLAAALAAALLLAVIGLALRGRGERSGEVEATARITLPLPPRGKAVLEPGAALRYAIAADGIGRVEQRRGTVRYQISPGGPFLVTTPVGEVQVVGTAFTVELVTMDRKPLIALAAVTALILTVYEGRVLLGNRHGQVPVAAGEHATLSAGTAPRVEPGPAPAPAQQARALGSGARPRDNALERERLLQEFAAARVKRQAQREEKAPLAKMEGPGTLDKDYVRGQMREIIPLIHECYSTALEREPKLQGRIMMKFTISGEPDLGGLVESAEVGEVNGNLADPGLHECMRESMYALRFKPPQGGGQVEVDYPFLLLPNGPPEDAPDGGAGAR